MQFLSPRILLLVGATLLGAGCTSSQPQGSKPPDSTSAQAPAPSGPTPPERPLPRSPQVERGFREAVSNETRTRSGRPGPRYWQQEVEYDLSARLLPADKHLEGAATITYTNNSPDTLNQLHLELAQNLHKPGAPRLSSQEVTGGVNLHHVAVDGTALSDTTSGPRYSVQNTQLILRPGQPVPPNSTVSIEVDWGFTIPQAGASGRMGYSRDNLFFLAYWYPQVSVYDDVTGWMDDPFLGLAEFYADFGDYDLTVHAPDEWVVQSTGRLQNADEVLTAETQARRRQAYTSDSTVTILPPDQRGTVEAESDTLSWRFTAERMRDVVGLVNRDDFRPGLNGL